MHDKSYIKSFNWCFSAGVKVSGNYDDASPSNHTGLVCGLDAAGKQILCGSQCSFGAVCYDPGQTSIRTGVFGRLLVSSSPAVSPVSGFSMANIDILFG